MEIEFEEVAHLKNSLRASLLRGEEKKLIRFGCQSDALSPFFTSDLCRLFVCEWLDPLLFSEIGHFQVRSLEEITNPTKTQSPK